MSTTPPETVIITARAIDSGRRLYRHRPGLGNRRQRRAHDGAGQDHRRPLDAACTGHAYRQREARAGGGAAAAATDGAGALARA